MTDWLWYNLRMGGQTRNWYLERAAEIPYEDQSRIVHQFPDGWSIRELMSNTDLAREGALMNNCWKNHWVGKDIHGFDTDEVDWNHPELQNNVSYKSTIDDPMTYTTLSLRDPDNLPRVSFYSRDGEISDPLGRHNSIARPEHLQRIGEWAGQTVAPYDSWGDGIVADEDWAREEAAGE